MMLRWTAPQVPLQGAQDVAGTGNSRFIRHGTQEYGLLQMHNSIDSVLAIEFLDTRLVRQKFWRWRGRRRVD